MTLRRKLGWFAVVAAGLLLVAAGGAFLLVRSTWFQNQVRARIVDTVEQATGGRVEIGSFAFDWRRVTAQVSDFVVHGTEPAGKPPLLRVSKIVVRLRIVSFLKHSVDIQSLEVTGPSVFLTVDADGHTNIPEPKLKKKPSGNTVETLLKLAIGRFAIRNGLFEVEGHGKTPMDVQGRNLQAGVQYRKDSAGPHYLCDLSIQPLDAHLGSYKPLPLGLTLSAVLDRNRITLGSLKLTSGNSRIDASGTVDNLNSPRASLHYEARVNVAEVTPILRIPELRRGAVLVTGVATGTGPGDFSVTGKVHGTELEYRDDTVHLVGFRTEASLAAGPKGVDLNGLELSGNYVTSKQQAPVDGMIAKAALRGRDLYLHDIALTAFGGSFDGEATVRNLVRYSITGEIAGMEGRRVVAMYSAEHLPWDALASGPVHVEGSFADVTELRATTNLAITPAPGSAPVAGGLMPTIRPPEEFWTWAVPPSRCPPHE